MTTIEYNDFSLYMREVDRFLLLACGLESADLPDYNYYADFIRGTPPERTARRARLAAI
jgi:hypothetical protein